MSTAPKQLGRYQIVEAIGKGGMGYVYQGWDPGFDRKVAIKTIALDKLSKEEAASLEARFREEALAAGKLIHQRIVGVYDVGREGDIAYMVMELIDGEDLGHLLKRGEQFNLERVSLVLQDLLEALNYVHEKAIVHRDIKPGNMLIDADGRVKLMDFGIARIAGSRSKGLTTVGAPIGTFRYMSPEQMRGDKDVDHRTDLWAAGVVLYQMLTGVRPFDGSGDVEIMFAVMQKAPPAPSSINPSISATVDAVVFKALEKERDRRYSSAREFGQALRNAMAASAGDRGSMPPSARPAAPVPRADGTPQPRPPNLDTSPSTRSAGTNTSVTQETDTLYWRSIIDSTDAEDFESYLEQFPSGTYAALARRRLRKLNPPLPVDGSTGSKAAVPADGSTGSKVPVTVDFDKEATQVGLPKPVVTAPPSALRQAPASLLPDDLIDLRSSSPAAPANERKSPAADAAIRTANEAAQQQAERARRDQMERAAREKAEREKAEQARIAALKAEKERIEKLKAEQVLAEQARIAAEKAESERLARETEEKERLSRQKAAQLRVEQERITAEKAEAERLARDKAEKDRLKNQEASQRVVEQQRSAAEKAEQDRLKKTRAEQELAEQERIAAAQKAAIERAERAEREKAQQEQIAKARSEQEIAERERIAAAQKAAIERAAREKAQQEQIAKQKADNERAELARVAAAQKAAKEQLERENAEKERLAKINAELIRVEKAPPLVPADRPQVPAAKADQASDPNRTVVGTPVPRAQPGNIGPSVPKGPALGSSDQLDEKPKGKGMVVAGALVGLLVVGVGGYFAFNPSSVPDNPSPSPPRAESPPPAPTPPAPDKVERPAIGEPGAAAKPTPPQTDTAQQAPAPTPAPPTGPANKKPPDQKATEAKPTDPKTAEAKRQADLKAAETKATEDKRQADLKAAEDKRQADLKAAEDKRQADLKAAETKATEDKRQADLKAAEDKRQADLKAAEDKRQADLRATEDKRQADLRAAEAARIKIKSPDEQFAEASASGNARQARAVFKKLAEEGHGPSQKRMWEIERDAKNESEAVRWQRKAYENKVPGVPQPKDPIKL